MRNLWISLFALIISMGSVMAESNIILDDDKEDKKEKKKEKEDTLFNKLKKELVKKEGKAADLSEGWSEYTGFTNGKPNRGKPNTRVKGSSDYGLYYDSKGILTGVHGRKIESEADKNKFFKATKEDADKALNEDVTKRIDQISSRIKDFKSFKPDRQVALFSSWYRGSLSGSPNTIKKINEKDYEGAAKEFLSNEEYMDEKRKEVISGRKSGIASRMEKTAAQLSDKIDPSSYKNIAAKSLYYGGLPKKENSRTPQSIEDKVNIQDSSIQKEDTMEIKRPEEEEEGKVDKARMERMQKSGETTDTSFEELNRKVNEGRDPVANFKDLAKRDLTIAALKTGIDTPAYSKLSRVEKDQAAEDAKDVTKMKNAATQSQQDKSEGKQGSVKNEFLEAITYFLPSIAGLAVGHAIGGGEGAAQGAQLGFKMGEAYKDRKDKQQELALKYGPQGTERNRKFQQSEYVDKEGNPITFDPTTNSYLKANGEKAEKGDFRDPIDARQARSLEMQQKRHDLAVMKTQHDISKDMQLSDKQQETFKAITETNESIKEIENMETKTLTGLGFKQLRNTQELFDKAPEAYTKLKAHTENLKAAYVKSISGAQVSEKEFERLSAVIPTVSDAPKVFMAKLKAMKKIQEITYKSFRKSVLVTQPLKMLTIKGVDKALKEVEDLEEKENVNKKSDISREEIDAMKEQIRKERARK